MGQLGKLLGGLRGNCTGRFLMGKKKGRSAGHVRSCPECASRQWRERQYLERLRGAAIPAASDDLTARLLARTQQLAMAMPVPAAVQPDPGATPAARAFGLAAGGAVAAVGVVAVAAYIIAGDPVPVAGGPPPPSLQQQASGALSLGTGGSLGNAGTAGTLSAAQLAVLRSEGWLCPELRDTGFHLLWARHEAVSGQGILELRLTDGDHFATVLEQHPPAGLPETAQLAATASSPTNVLTGHPAMEDGFLPAPGRGAPPGGKLWVNPAVPWKAIYEAAGVTFTYVSDLPAEEADDGIAELMRAETAVGAAASPGGQAAPAAAQADTAPEALPARLKRGFDRIMGLFSP